QRPRPSRLKSERRKVAPIFAGFSVLTTWTTLVVPVSGHAVARERRQPGQSPTKLRERRLLSRRSCPEYHPTADRSTSCSLPSTPGQGRPHRGSREAISSVQQLRRCQPGEW